MLPPNFPELHHAMANGSIELLRLAVAAGESLEAFEVERKSSVIVDLMRVCAERSQDPPLVSELLEMGADANLGGWFELSPLPYVLVRGSMDTQTLTSNVVSLLCHGADVNRLVPNTIASMAWRPRHKEYLSYPLALAIQIGNLSAAEAILLGGASPDGPGGKDVLNPLSVSAIWKEPAITKLLLKKGANAHLCNSDGTSPLHHCWDEDIAQLLFRAGAIVSCHDERGRLPMHEWVERAAKASTLEWIADIAPKDRFAVDHAGVSPFRTLRERVNVDETHAHWLAPILSKWEADFIGQSTTERIRCDSQGRRL
jgi:hypothetical protein